MTREDPTAEFMRQAVESLDNFAYNALRDLPDRTSMYGQAAGFAALLGYQPESFPPYAGIAVKSSQTMDTYVPGVAEIDDPNDHIRGLTSVIINAPITTAGQLQLLDRLVVSAASKYTQDHPMSLEHYKRIVGGEIDAQMPPVAGRQVHELPVAVKEKWYPPLSRRIQAGFWAARRLLPSVAK